MQGFIERMPDRLPDGVTRSPLLPGAGDNTSFPATSALRVSFCGASPAGAQAPVQGNAGPGVRRRP